MHLYRRVFLNSSKYIIEVCTPSCFVKSSCFDMLHMLWFGPHFLKGNWFDRFDSIGI